MPTHPAIEQFRRELTARTVSPTKKEAFRKFRENKLAEGSEDRVAADALWNECEQLGNDEIGREWRKSIARSPVASKKPARGGAPGGGRQAPAAQAMRRDFRTPPPQTRFETDNRGAADPACLEEAFHNPYTFLPFPPKDWFEGKRKRRPPTPLTQDEVELERFTGVVDLELATLSPLLSCHPEAAADHLGRKKYVALTNGDDVIVPATGVRGSLRALMTIINGGTLGYLDDAAWLVQARDLPLGPAATTSAASVPKKPFLARVVQPGTATSPGKIQLGQTLLIRAEDLQNMARQAELSELPRPKSGRRIEHLWIDEMRTSVSKEEDDRHPWQLKLSGRPINKKGKREGMFLADGPIVDIAEPLWAAYLGRNRHGDHRELKKDDLVWLEPADPGLTEIKSANDIESIQWARWGRKGEQLLRLINSPIHEHVLPDCFRSDELVDETTDLFGQVPARGYDKAAGPFAARIRPENLVFRDAAKDKDGIQREVTLSPLLAPHPGCAAFYRDTIDADAVTNRDLPLRGYKVYRTTKERGAAAPWLFSAQGVYKADGTLEKAQQKFNKTCDLLAEGRTGHLRIACRSLSQRELALLLLACSVDWRLGGGKPLGLGHCRPHRVTVRDDRGNVHLELVRQGEAPAELPEPYASEVADLLERRNLWHASQLPVDRLRYPRAVEENEHRKQRGGHSWFQRHANPRKGQEGDRPPRGLQVLWTAEELERKAGKNRIRAQLLPQFDPKNPQGDVLYGYDLFAGHGDEWSRQAGNNQTHFKKLEPFDPKKHARGTDQSSGKVGQTSKTRSDQKKDSRNKG